MNTRVPRIWWRRLLVVVSLIAVLFGAPAEVTPTVVDRVWTGK